MARRIPQFRPVPLNLRRTRYGARYREYARFYALYKTMRGITKRASFQVRLSPRLSNKQKGRLIRTTVNNILDKKIPEHRQGDVFDSFRELLYRTNWLKVRKILNYKAGVVYER